MAVRSAPAEQAGGIRSWSQAAWSRWQREAISRPALALMVLWAVAEATVWPVIPDLLLAPLALGARRKFARPLLACVAGSAFGGAWLYLLAWLHPDDLRAFVAHLPLVTDGQVARADRWLDQGGTLALLRQPVSGVPFKVWAVEGVTRGIPPLQAVPLLIAVRTLRMAVIAGVAALAGARGADRLRAWFLPCAVVYVALGAAGLGLVLR